MTAVAEAPVVGLTPSRSGTYQEGESVVHINAPAAYTFRLMAWCWNCDQKRRCVGRFQTWYGTAIVCCHCGDGWADGETKPRPFERGWREKSIARAKKQWNESAAFDRNVLRAMLKRDTGQ